MKHFLRLLTLPIVVIVLLISLSQSFLMQEDHMEEEEGRYPKQFMLEEMYRQWKEMLQDPQGNIPMDRSFAAWKYAGELMKRQQYNELNGYAVPGLSWVSRGPSNVGGRTRSLLVDPNDATGNTVFAGSVGGGLWKCTNMKAATPTWTPVNDFMDNLAIGTLAYDPSNTSTFYAGTGEGFNSADAARGNGIMKSTNAGLNWSFLSSTVNNSNFYYVNKLVVLSNGVVVAATSTGLFTSSDGGTTWIIRISGAFGDVEKASDGKLFAASKSGGNGIYFSTDNGTSWTLASTGIPTGLTGYSRYELATAPSDANRVYVMVFNYSTKVTTFYKSTDAGLSYAAIGTPVDADGGISSSDITRSQGWYDLILKVDPNNADVVYTGGIDLFKTTNGGTSWYQITHWYGGFTYQNVHADQHFIEFEGSNSSVIYFANDGGVYQTTNGTATTPTITARNTNYNVTQFYACAMHPTSGSNLFLAGAQDNGTQKFTVSGLGATSQASGGDGAYCNIDQQNPTYMFSQYVYNNYYRSSNGGSTFGSVANSFSSTGRFINPTRYDNNLKVLYGATDAGKFLRWKNATTSTTFDTVRVVAMGTQTVSALTVSAITADKTFLGTGNGQIIEVSGASTVTSPVAGRSLGTPGSGYVNCIWEDSSNANHMIIVMTGFGRTNIFETNNATAASPTWIGKDGDLPDMPVFWVLPEPGNSSKSVLIATEYGVWSTDNFDAATPNWTINSNGLARCRVTQLYYRSNDNTLVASTFGRGLFTTTFIPSNTCGTPTGLSNSGLTATSASVSWSAMSNATNYDVDYKVSTSATWVNAASATTSTSVSLSGLTPGTVYDWRVRTNCASGTSSYAAAQLTTSSACGTPTGLSSGSITTTSATVSWTTVASALNYKVEYKTSAATVWTVADTAYASASYPISGLTAATTYNWRVSARCSAGLGSTASASFTTSSPPVCNDAYESNNTFTAAKTITIGSTINASISSGTDVDYFKITTPNSTATNLKITLGNLPADYDIFLYNKNQVLLKSSELTGTVNDVIVQNSAGAKIIYYIKVAGKSGANNTAQCYSLQVLNSSAAWPGANLEGGISNLATLEDVPFAVYPNPATGQLNVRWTSSNSYSGALSIHSITGQVLKRKPINVNEGYNYFAMPLQGIQPGMYFINITGNGVSYQRKVVIQ